MIDVRKCVKFVKKVEETLYITLADNGLTDLTKNLLFKDTKNCLELYFKRNGSEELILLFKYIKRNHRLEFSLYSNLKRVITKWRSYHAVNLSLKNFYNKNL